MHGWKERDRERGRKEGREKERGRGREGGREGGSRIQVVLNLQGNVIALKL